MKEIISREIRIEPEGHIIETVISHEIIERNGNFPFKRIVTSEYYVEDPNETLMNRQLISENVENELLYMDRHDHFPVYKPTPHKPFFSEKEFKI